MTVVCIAGMHRSGTSMIARLLNLAGVYLGEGSDFLPPAPDNPEGFWENYRFYLINEEIISWLGGAWDQPPILEPGWETAPALDQCRTEARRLLAKMEPHANWGWKDPRNSLTLPFWRQLIPGIKVIVCLRDPIEVANSLTKRGSTSRLFSMRLWQAYMVKMIQDLQGMDWILTHYDAYFHKPEAELRRLTNFLEMDVSDQTLREACQFIRLDQNHNHFVSIGSDQLKAFPEVQALYSDLCGRAGAVYQMALDNSANASAQPGSITPEAEAQPSKGTDTLVQNLYDRILRDSARIQSLESEAEGLEHQLSEIYRSKGWRFLQWIRQQKSYIRPAKRTPPF